ncbi:DUF4332 domain-containing protein [Candidatus Dependentiae bacterium]|nr:DUF4332 domain-containing protein [Candidatus Dependentiae bacterium]
MSKQRKKISKDTGVPLETILELVKLSDLTRLGAVKAVRAQLYYDAGIDSIEKMATWDSNEMRKMVIEFIQRTKFKGIPPTPKETAITVNIAKELKKVVDFK